MVLNLSYPDEIPSSQASFFVQRGGPNSPVEYVGQHGILGYTEPLGEVTRGYQFDDRGEYENSSVVRNPPGDVTFGIVTGLRGKPSPFDSLLRCIMNIYLVHSSCARPNVYTKYDRVALVRNVALGNLDEGDLVAWDTDTRIQRNFSATGASPGLRAWKMSPAQIGTNGLDMQDTHDFISITPCQGGLCGRQCYGECGMVYVIYDNAEDGGLVAGRSPDGVWYPSANRPFGAAVNPREANHLHCLESGRLLAVFGPNDADEWAASFSDDGGFSWVDYLPDPDAPLTSTSLLWSITSAGDVVLVGGTEGKIFRSEDGGVTWETVVNGDYGSGGYRDIVLLNKQVGYALSATALIGTYDGGVTWVQMTAPAGSGMQSIAVTNQYVWVVGGGVWYRKHSETDWSLRSLPTSYPTTTVPFTKIRAYNDYVLCILQAGTVSGQTVNRLFYTITGGSHQTWVFVDMGTAPGGMTNDSFAPAENFRQIAFCDYRTIYAVGDNRLAAKISA